MKIKSSEIDFMEQRLVCSVFLLEHLVTEQDDGVWRFAGEKMSSRLMKLAKFC